MSSGFELTFPRVNPRLDALFSARQHVLERWFVRNLSPIPREGANIRPNAAVPPSHPGRFIFKPLSEAFFMNKTNINHGMIAICLQMAIFICTGNYWYGFFFAAGVFWSREHDQKQHHIAKAKNCTLNELSWYEGGDMTKWSKDSLLDFLVPFVATLATALIGETNGW